MLGAYYLDALNHQDIEQWFQVMAPKASPSTVNNRLRVLKMCLGDASAELGIPNPAARVRRLPLPMSQRRGLTTSQLRAFLAAYDHVETKPLIMTLALTGMRWGEATALRWEDIETSENFILVRRGHRFNMVNEPKSGRIRTVPLCSELAGMLTAHRQRLIGRQDPGMEAGWCFATVAARGKHKGAIRLRNPSSVRTQWRKACEEVGVTATPHDLRRTFVDLLRLAQVDAVVEHAIVGHADEKMRQHYSTVRSPEATQALSRVVDLVMGS